MSQSALAEPVTALYHSPLGLYPFQAEDIAKSYLMGSGMVAWSTGTGKSHWAMATASLLFEDDLIDRVLLVCERNKVAEWVQDFGTFTHLSATKHHGTGRQARLSKHDPLPQVIVTTYETAKADGVRLITTPGKRGKSLAPGSLLEVVLGERVLVVYDESTKIKNRSSANYQAHEFMVRHLRKANPATRVWGLTATPIERDYEDAFNQFRILTPWAMPLIKDFEHDYVASRDPYGRPKFKAGAMPAFAALCAPFMLIRHKTDPDLIAQFPKQVEEAHHIAMGDLQRKFYTMLEEIGMPEDSSEDPVPGLWTVMRQVAGHPAALLASAANEGGAMLSKILVEELGADYIRSIPSAKTEWLLEYLDPLVNGQGAKVVVFTFFGQSVLPLLAQALAAKKFRVHLNHGGMSGPAQEASRAAFRADPRPCVFLTSDAGARGINLPEATYVTEYESALTFANRTQRINRIHRIDSQSASVTCMTAILDRTVEEQIAVNMIGRNAQTDILLGDTDGGEHFMTAAERKAALSIARTYRPSAPTRKP